jgi:plastocyanin
MAARLLALLMGFFLSGGALVNSAPPAAAGKTWAVLIEGFKFVPEKLEVAAGDTVVWKNEDIVPHTATAKKIFDSKNLDKGQSWSYVVKQKGTFAYICTYHPTMKAELTVR